MTHPFRTAILTPTLFLFISMTLWLPAANAAILSTGSAEQNRVSKQAETDTIQTFLLDERVQQQLVQMGVEPELATLRVAALTPAERLLVEQKIANLPAGAGLVEIIGIVFIVLLILELLGVTDIFKKI